MEPSQEILFEAAKRSPEAYAELFAKIRLQDGVEGLFKPNVLQRRIFAYDQARFHRNAPARQIGLKPRKQGFSTAGQLIGYHRIMTHPFELALIGHVDRSSTETLAAMQEVFRRNCPLLCNGYWGGPLIKSSPKLVWDLGDDIGLARMGRYSALKPESIRGSTPNIVTATEAAYYGANDFAVFEATINAVPEIGYSSIMFESTMSRNADGTIASTSGAFAKTFLSARWPTAEECPEGREYWKIWEHMMPQNSGIVTQSEADQDGAEWVRIFAAWYEFEYNARKISEERKQEIQNSLTTDEQDLIDRYGNEHPITGVTRLGYEADHCDVWEQLAWRRWCLQNKCQGDVQTLEREYPRDPKSCFEASGRKVFAVQTLSRWGKSIQHQRYRQGVLEPLKTRGFPIPYGANFRETMPNEVSWIRVFEEPVIGRSYLGCVDLAEGKAQTKGADTDMHASHMLRQGFVQEGGVIFKPTVAATLYDPQGIRWNMEVLVERVFLMSLYYGNAIIAPEINAVGQAFLALATNIWNMMIWNRTEFEATVAGGQTGTSSRVERPGWKTTPATRKLIVENGKSVIAKGEFDMPDIGLLSELNAFIENPKNGKAEAEPGAHDDKVMAFLIGLYLLNYATECQPPQPKSHLPAELEKFAGIHNRDRDGSYDLF